MKKEENILGYEKISRLMLRFSIPCIISMLVNSLYNIVDQVFIGWGVGVLGNGATSVVFPINMIVLALSLMIGDGTGAYLSLKLGEKKKDEASKGVGNGLILSSVISILLCILCLIFLPQLLNLFGCTNDLRDYATSYGYIIVLGIPFNMISIYMNSIIRSDGDPKYSMMSMLSGAILNMILDPIFIFIFKMGVNGAAIATVISQIVSFIINIIYVKKFKSISLTKKDFKLVFSTCFKLLSLGISSLITQMSIVFVIAIENNLLVKYGAQSEFGDSVPLAVMGIVMKINQILNSIILGIAIGSQPIIGYNYGANKLDRVKSTLKLVLFYSVIISTIAFLLFQLIPDKLILIFGNGDASYIKFAVMSFKIYLLLVICNGIQIPSGIFFQAIGKSGKSALLSLSRQILILIPAMIILGDIASIKGVLYAGPCADGIAFILSIILLFFEIRRFNKRKESIVSLDDDTSVNTKNNKHIIITISREYGSGGRYVGRLIADKLGIKFYDKEILEKIEKDTGYTVEYLEEKEQKLSRLDILNSGYYSGLSNADELFINESNAIKKLSKKDSCVIIGRCSDFILKDNKDVVKVFIYSSLEDKVNRIKNYYGLNEKEALKEIKRQDKLRSNHYKHYTSKNWHDFNNYDICINSDKFGVEKTADIICEYIEKR